MTAQFIKLGNTIGWFDSVTKTWQGTTFKEANLSSFILSLPYDLQDDLIAYTQANPLLPVIFNTGKISLEDIDKLIARVEYDYTNNKLLEDLKNAIVAALEGLR
jgi:hypothetical protein